MELEISLHPLPLCPSRNKDTRGWTLPTGPAQTPRCLPLVWASCDSGGDGRQLWLLPLRCSHRPVPLRKTSHPCAKVLLCQCQTPPRHPLLLSQLGELGLSLLYNPDDQVMPADACSISFVFAATVNRYDTRVHSCFITGFCFLKTLSRAELFYNHIPSEFSCQFSSA